MGYTEGHHGVISVRIASRHGIERGRLYHFVRMGRLIQTAPETYVVAGSPRTWHQRAMVASLSSRGWNSHRSAAALNKLDGFPQRSIEVITHYGRTSRRCDWTVHRTRQLGGVDLAEIDGIPCTSIVRTVMDLAAVAGPDVVARALDELCCRVPNGLELFTSRFLELARRGRPGTKLLRDLLAERHGQKRFAQSGFETLTVKLVCKAGLPRPVLQYEVVVNGGIRVYLDLAWPEICWAVECDSLAWHSGKRAHEWDRRRRRLLKAAGWDLAEVTYDDVTKQAAETAEQLRYLYIKRRDTFNHGRGVIL